MEEWGLSDDRPSNNIWDYAGNPERSSCIFTRNSHSDINWRYSLAKQESAECTCIEHGVVHQQSGDQGLRNGLVLSASLQLSTPNSYPKLHHRSLIQWKLCSLQTSSFHYPIENTKSSVGAAKSTKRTIILLPYYSIQAPCCNSPFIRLICMRK